MVIAVGVAKRLVYKAETTFGVAPSAGGAQELRRIESTLDLRKETYQSAEIRSDYQMADFRHGVRSVEGSIRGELSPGTWKDFYAAALRRTLTTVTNMTGLSITIATGSVINGFQTYTLTRSAGSYLTDGLKTGNVTRLTAGAFNAANVNKNLLVISLTATVATVIPLNGVALVAEGPIASATQTVPGSKTFVPTTGHTDPSFAIEHYYGDLDETELFLGCKVARVALEMPPSGLAGITLDFMGRDMSALSGASAPYYTSPTAVTATGVLAAVNGALVVQGNPIAVVTGLTININGNMSAEPVVGSNLYPDIFEGRVIVDGQFTAFFDSVTVRDYFLNETEVSLIAALTTSGLAAADFLAFTLPRLKVGGASKDDGEKGLVLTLPFQALFNSPGGSGTASEQSTIAIQDSA